jgi:hypothetical protein
MTSAVLGRVWDWHCAGPRVGVDDSLQISNRAEDTATDALAGHLGEETLDRIQPRSGSRREMEDPARMA